MTDLLITMNSSGAFSLPGNVGRIEEYCAKRLKIKLNTEFLSSAIKYYTLSFEPFSLGRKIITENIYVDSETSDGIYFSDGYIYCPIYDYIAVSPNVMVQLDGYETDGEGNVTTIIKSGIFTLEFSPSLTGEGVMLQTTRPDVKFKESVENAVNEAMKTRVLDGANLKNFSVTDKKINVETIDTWHLKNLCVTYNKIALKTINADCLDEACVTTEKLADKCVTSEKISANAVNAEKICDKNVTTEKLADASVTNAKLANHSVTDSKIRPLTITAGRIANGTITPAKLDRTYLTQHQSLLGYATQNWVKSQNYINKHQSLDGYATEDWVKKQNYLKEHQSLEGYATEDWIKKQGYITDVSDKASKEDLPEKLSDLENDIAVTFTSQILTESQKDTVLQNIGAVKNEEGKVLSQNDFTDEDKEKLDAALTQHQDISMKVDKESLAEVSFSGSYNDLEDLPDLDEIRNIFNDQLKERYETAYEHSLVEHAPANAQENVIESIEVNGEETEIKGKKALITVMKYEVCEPIFVEV